MRTPLVIIASPRLQHSARVRQGSEQCLVQQLVAQASVEALVEAVLLGLAGRDVMPADAGVVGLGQDRVRSVLDGPSPESESGRRFLADLLEVTARSQEIVSDAGMRMTISVGPCRREPDLQVRQWSQYSRMPTEGGPMVGHHKNRDLVTYC